ncbi:MAG: ABC transporter ATP-binding protein [bacterium]|jgi:iron complex transport system ATP-binding protein|nr:ABC transporter ATP-binding protein [bacterium]
MPALLEMNNVTVIRDGKRILDQISWTMQSNEHWAVIGKNGAGKSFLLQLLSANFHPTAGTVRVMGEELGKVNLWDLRTKIGLVSDTLHRRYHEYLPMIDVVCSGFFASIGLYDAVTAEMRHKAEAILEQTGLAALRDRAFGDLSHGEQRRTLIARALVFNPRILILDEPCSGLDIPSRESFLGLVQELGEAGHNLVFVTHHMEEVLPVISHVLYIKDGLVFAQGPKEKMMQSHVLEPVFDYPIPLVQSEGRYWPKFFT